MGPSEGRGELEVGVLRGRRDRGRPTGQPVRCQTVARVRPALVSSEDFSSETVEVEEKKGSLRREAGKIERTYEPSSTEDTERPNLLT